MAQTKINDRSDPNQNAGVITGTSRQVANLSAGFILPSHQSEMSLDTTATETTRDPSSVPLEKSDGPVVARPNDRPSGLTGTVAHIGKSSPQPAGTGVTFHANTFGKGKV